MSEKFSLKDYLFNKSKVEGIASEIEKHYLKFKKTEFVKTVVSKFPELELKQRITWISDNFKKFLPNDFRTATTILLNSLPNELDPEKTDDDFGEFILAPYAEFIAKNGCNEKDLKFSLSSLKEITKRFSVEDAIRYFINAFSEETMKELLEWSKDKNYHVRRLSSEGTRPKLPWSQKINIDPVDVIPILDNLYSDKTRYVTRSVANHVNDISKTNPNLVLKTLERWQKSKIQSSKEMDYIINHSLRTLVKLGNKDAINFLGFSHDPKIEISDFKLKSNKVKLNDNLEFNLTLNANKDENLIVDYVIYFKGKKENGNNKKVFKLKKFSLKKNKSIVLSKKHKMRGGMTTRKLIPGLHKVEIQVNGKKLGVKEFELIS
jgi:3-methyladenine DNA glycosylase AlkC